MDKQFVPYNIAIVLKELGYDEPCVAYYVKKLTGAPLRFIWEEEITHTITNSDGHGIVAPLYQQVFDWFNKNYNLCGYPKHDVYEIYKDEECIVEQYSLQSYTDSRILCIEHMIELLNK